MNIQDALEAAGILAPLLGVALMVLQSLISPIPFALVVIALGAFFGPWWGALISWVGELLGASLAYALAYYGFSRFVPPASDWVLEKRGFLALVGLRMLPGLSFDVVSYACGAARVPFATFLLSTMIGSVPRIVAFSVYGHSLWEHPVEAVLLILPLGLLSLLVSRRMSSIRPQEPEAPISG